MAARRTILVRTVLDSVGMAKCLENAAAVLERLSGWEISQRANDVITFKVSTGFQSWGEEVVIKIQEPDFWVRSECVVPFQFLDWGKNEENTDLVIKALNQSITATA